MKYYIIVLSMVAGLAPLHAFTSTTAVTTNASLQAKPTDLSSQNSQKHSELEFYDTRRGDKDDAHSYFSQPVNPQHDDYTSRTSNEIFRNSSTRSEHLSNSGGESKFAPSSSSSPSSFKSGLSH